MWTPPRLDDAGRAAADAIRSARRPLLVGHAKPDSDVLGSQAALAEGLAALGAHPAVRNPDGPPKGYDFITPACGFGHYRNGALPRHDLVILLDLCDLGRTGPLAARIAASPAPKLVIDHHVLPAEPWWDLAVVDTSAAATGVLVGRLLAHLGVALEGLIAHGLMVALVGDTGSFRFDNTDVEAFELAALCTRAGASSAEVYRRLGQARDARFPSALAEVLGALQYLDDGRVALVAEPRSLGTGGLLGLSDTVLDVLRSVESVEIALHLRELEDGTCKLSARAKAPAEVLGLARRLGGGGHVRAAGATIEGDLGAALERVHEALEATLSRTDAISAARVDP